jgi:monoamine oxidase
MPEFSADLIVIGAGVAGLAAAREAQSAARSVIVLEARNRIGGRIHTVPSHVTEAGNTPVELGAEFVHGLHPALWDILREAGLSTVESEGKHLVRTETGLAESGDFAAMDDVFQTMSEAPDQSFADFLRPLNLPAHLKQSLTGYVEGFNAACKERVSVAWLNTENQASHDTEGDRAFRVVKGYSAVPEYLAQGLDIRLSTPVRRLQWKPGEAIAQTGAAAFRAPQCIVTVPLALLNAGALPIDPEPAALTNARTAIETGPAIRVTFRFRTAPWHKHPDLSFLQGDRPFPVWWTSHPIRNNQITGWTAGPKAHALANRPRHEIIALALTSLRELLGEDPDEPESAHFHDWQQDPWSLGAYSFGTVNGAQARHAFAEPIAQTLCFAGEAVCPEGHMGTVHGALASGIAAARRLIALSR